MPALGLRKMEWAFPLRGKWLIYFLAGILVAGLLIAAWDVRLGSVVHTIVELGGPDG